MFGDRCSGGSGDERRGRRDVDRARAVATGSRSVDEVVAFGPNGEHVAAHRLGAAGDLVRSLALRAQGDEEAPDLRGRRLAAHDLAHHLARLFAPEIVPVEQPLQCLLDHRLRKFRAIWLPSGVSTDSGWNCTPSTGSVPVTHGHHFAAVCRRRDLELGRDPCRGERVVAAGLQLQRQAFEQAAAVVLDRARLTVDELARLADLASVSLHDRLMPEADTKRRRRRCEATHDLECRAGVARPAGSGGDDEMRRREARGGLRVDCVVASYNHFSAKLAEQIGEVVRERVVVVDEEDQRCSDSARSIAASTAASLRRHSSCSAAGSESATMPAPACRCATPSRSTIDLIAMHVSRVSSSGSA